MGQELSGVSIEEAASVSCPGRKCFVTSPLDEFCDYDRLWLELKSGLKTDFVKDPLLAHAEVEEISEDEFSITKTYDAAKMNLPPESQLRARCCYLLDKEKGEVYEEVREMMFDAVAETRVLRTLRDPLRLEMYSQRVQETRRADPFVQFSLGNIIKSVVKQDVITAPWIPSKLGGGRPDLLCAATQPLDDVANFDDLMKGIQESYETQALNPFAKDVKLGKVRTTSRFSMFDVVGVLDGEKAAQAQLSFEPKDHPFRMHVEHTRVKPDDAEEMGAFSAMTFDLETRQLREAWRMVVYQKPLYIEAWAHDPVNHEVDPEAFRRAILAAVLHGYVSVLLERLKT